MNIILKIILGKRQGNISASNMIIGSYFTIFFFYRFRLLISYLIRDHQQILILFTNNYPSSFFIGLRQARIHVLSPKWM